MLLRGLKLLHRPVLKSVDGVSTGKVCFSEVNYRWFIGWRLGSKILMTKESQTWGLSLLLLRGIKWRCITVISRLRSRMVSWKKSFIWCNYPITARLWKGQRKSGNFVYRLNKLIHGLKKAFQVCNETISKLLKAQSSKLCIESHVST